MEIWPAMLFISTTFRKHVWLKFPKLFGSLPPSLTCCFPICPISNDGILCELWVFLGHPWALHVSWHCPGHGEPGPLCRPWGMLALAGPRAQRALNNGIRHGFFCVQNYRKNKFIMVCFVSTYLLYFIINTTQLQQNILYPNWNTIDEWHITRKNVLIITAWSVKLAHLIVLQLRRLCGLEGVVLPASYRWQSSKWLRWSTRHSVVHAKWIDPNVFWCDVDAGTVIMRSPIDNPSTRPQTAF